MTTYGSLPSDGEASASTTKDDVVERIGRGLKLASAAVAQPAGSEVEGLLDATDLPDVEGNEPLLELVHRLDREADLYRNLAFREMARSAWVTRLLMGLMALVVVANVGVAAVAALGVLFGASDAGGRAVLVLTVAAVSVSGLVAAGFVAAGIRRGQQELLRGALARADLAELRLHRIALVLAWQKADGAGYQAALGRLEDDAADRQRKGHSSGTK